MSNDKHRTVLQAPEEGFEPPTRRLTVALASEGDASAHSANVGHGTPEKATASHHTLTLAITPGLVRWVVFQCTARGRFRLTQYLYAIDKDAATATADAWYAGCTGPLHVMSWVEYQVVLDDLATLRRSRIAPKLAGQKRPSVRRGVSFGTCVYCGAVTSAPGGRSPKYCASHRERKFQRACRTGRPVIETLAQGMRA